MSKNNVDWVRALKDLEEAKKLQKKKRRLPAWVWFFVPGLLLFGWVQWGKDEGKPKTNTHGHVLGADGNYHTGRTAWEDAEAEARTSTVSRGQTLTVADGCWGYATARMAAEACAAAGKHAETYAQYNRDAAAAGQAEYFGAGERVKVVDIDSGWDTYCRVRRDGDRRAWWLLRGLLSM